jgi:hypothetical protein
MRWRFATADEDARVLAELNLLVGNTAARSFWKANGFTDYAITLELDSLDESRA